MLITLVILTIIGVLLFLTFDEDFMFWGGVLLFLTIILGWVAAGLSVTQKSTYYISNSTRPSVELIDNSFMVFYKLEDGTEKMQQFYSLKDIPLKTATQFVVEKNFNMYGELISEQIKSPYVKDSTKVPAFLEKVEIKK